MVDDVAQSVEQFELAGGNWELLKPGLGLKVLGLQGAFGFADGAAFQRSTQYKKTKS